MPIPEDIRQWRRDRRGELLSRRHHLSREVRRRSRDSINHVLAAEFPTPAEKRIGFYWPIKDEIDVTPAVEDLIARGARAALPVIVERGAPLEFWSWTPGSPMDRGVWDIPVPRERAVVHPGILFVPVLGFDDACYRLGYGGGYYDRTLATMTPRPLTIGIGYEGGHLESVFPQEHDIALDAIVTEARVIRRS